MGVLAVEDRRTHKTAHMKLDVRTFSYRPLATFVALGLATRLKGRRKNLLVLGGGLAMMMAYADRRYP